MFKSYLRLVIVLGLIPGGLLLANNSRYGSSNSTNVKKDVAIAAGVGVGAGVLGTLGTQWLNKNDGWVSLKRGFWATYEVFANAAKRPFGADPVDTGSSPYKYLVRRAKLAGDKAVEDYKAANERTKRPYSATQAETDREDAAKAYISDNIDEYFDGSISYDQFMAYLDKVPGPNFFTKLGNVDAIIEGLIVDKRVTTLQSGSKSSEEVRIDALKYAIDNNITKMSQVGGTVEAAQARAGLTTGSGIGAGSGAGVDRPGLKSTYAQLGERTQADRAIDVAALNPKQAAIQQQLAKEQASMQGVQEAQAAQAAEADAEDNPVVLKQRAALAEAQARQGIPTDEPDEGV